MKLSRKKEGVKKSSRTARLASNETKGKNQQKGDSLFESHRETPKGRKRGKKEIGRCGLRDNEGSDENKK